MSTYATLKAALKTELDAVVTSGEIKDALEGRFRKSSGMPYARYYMQGHDSSQITTGGTAGSASDWDTVWRFGVDIVGDFSSTKTAKQAETDFTAAVNAVVAKLQKEWSLGSDDSIKSILGETIEEQGGDGTILAFRMIVEIETFNSYT